MKLYAPDKTELMDVKAISRDGNNLIIKGKIMGALPMNAVVRPEEARRGLRLLSLRLVLFLVTFLFRSSKDAE
jgi:uncharacterized protein (DUF1786 family)